MIKARLVLPLFDVFRLDRLDRLFRMRTCNGALAALRRITAIGGFLRTRARLLYRNKRLLIQLNNKAEYNCYHSRTPNQGFVNVKFPLENKMIRFSQHCTQYGLLWALSEVFTFFI